MTQNTTLQDLQKTIGLVIRTGMTDKSLLTIEYVSGFEMFGTHETWGQGWRVSGTGVKDKLITTSNSDLEIAVTEWIKKYEKL